MIDAKALDLIKKSEGLRLNAYRDAVGVWTIGYGTTAAAGVGIEPKEGMTITEAEAEMYLAKGVEKFADAIRPLITRDINPNEFGAFVSLAYNIGPSAFARSTALKRFNAGDKAGAADAILWWNKAGGKVLRGLVTRRDRERDLFLTPSTPEIEEGESGTLPDIYDKIAALEAENADLRADVAEIRTWALQVNAWIKHLGGKRYAD